MKRMMSGCAVIACLAASTLQAQAQTFPDLQIRMGPYMMSTYGGEQSLNMWWSTGPVVIGKTHTSTFSLDSRSCDGWSVSSASEVRDDASMAWKIEVTPIRVIGSAVTFRLRWVRLDGMKQRAGLPFDKASQMKTDDLELTLHPGESAPVDMVRVAEGAKTVEGRPCGRSSSIRVMVEPNPWEGEERRLVGAELWLVERLPNGTHAQRGEPLTLRALPNRAFSFYFDRMVDGNTSLDVYGTLNTHLASGAIDVDVETRVRWKSPSDPPGFAGPQRFTEAKLQVQGTEIVEVQLPAFGVEAGPFAKRTFSIRIRARQLR